MLRLGGIGRRSLRLLCVLLVITGGTTVLAGPAQASTFPVDLGVTLTIDEPVVAGGFASFHLLVTNHGPSEIGPFFYVDVTNDVLELDADPPPAGCVLHDGFMTCTPDGPLNGGASLLWEGSFAIPASTPHQEVTYSAVLSITDPDAVDPNPDNNTSSVGVELHHFADLAVSLSVDPDSVAAGGDITYTVTVTNLGPGDASGVFASGIGPDDSTVHDATSSPPGSCGAGENSFSCSLGTLSGPGGGSDVATITAHASAALSMGTKFAEARVVESDSDPDTSNNISIDSTEVVHGTADVSVDGEASASSVAADQNMGFDFTVSNAGPDLATDVQLSVTFDRLVIVDTTSGSCSYTDVLECSVGPVGQGSPSVVHVSAFPIEPGALTAHASVSTSSDDPESSNDQDDVGVSVTAASGVHYVAASDHGFVPDNVTVKQGETVQWNFPFDTTTGHTATDPTQMHLFDSGVQTAIFLAQYQFTAAGRYRVSDEAAHFDGIVRVPLRVKPGSGGLSTGFKLTWATGAPAAGFVYDVQIKRPGTTTWVYWKSDTTLPKANFIPDGGPGTYQFRSRLRRVFSGAASGWSGAKSIVVS